jgi:hypothetical protein
MESAAAGLSLPVLSDFPSTFANVADAPNKKPSQ